MDHRQQTLGPPGVPVPRMPPVRDAIVGMHLGEPGQRLVDDQPPLNVRADLRLDALERRRVQERIGSVGEAVLHEILAEHRSQAQLAVRPTHALPLRLGSWLRGLDANAGINDLTPLAGGKGKDGIEVELGDLRDFFNHQRDTQQNLFQGFHVCRWMPSVTL